MLPEWLEEQVGRSRARRREGWRVLKAAVLSEMLLGGDCGDTADSGHCLRGGQRNGPLGHPRWAGMGGQKWERKAGEGSRRSKQVGSFEKFGIGSLRLMLESVEHEVRLVLG